MAYRDFILTLSVAFCLLFAAQLEKGNSLSPSVESGSGYNKDSDDEEAHLLEGISGDYAPTSLCRRQEIEASARRQPGSYIPKCGASGEFIERQCHLEECWCVNRHGHAIKETRHLASVVFDCLNFQKSTALLSHVTRRQTAKAAYSAVVVTSTLSSNAVNERPDDVIIDETKDTKHHKNNKLDQMTYESNVDIGLANPDTNEIEASMLERKATISPLRLPIHNRPGLLAGIIGGTTLALVCIVLFVMFLVYRMRKKDEGSYALDEPKNSPSTGFKKSNDREFFA